MNVNEPEEWRPVVGFEGRYEVSSLGRVRSMDCRVYHQGVKRSFFSYHKGQPLRQTSRGGYLAVMLPHKSGNYHQRPVNVHQLVAEAFLGPRPHGMDICHGDGVKKNNATSNLRYASRRENEADKIAHGTDQRGERHPRAKLTAEQVRQIRLLAPYDSQEILAGHYGVTKSLISKIVTNECWKDGPFPVRCGVLL